MGGLAASRDQACATAWQGHHGPWRHYLKGGLRHAQVPRVTFLSLRPMKQAGVQGSPPGSVPEECELGGRGQGQELAGQAGGALVRASVAWGSGSSSCLHQRRAHRASGLITPGLGAPGTLAPETPDGVGAGLRAGGGPRGPTCLPSQTPPASPGRGQGCTLGGGPWRCVGVWTPRTMLSYFLSHSSWSEAGCAVC